MYIGGGGGGCVPLRVADGLFGRSFAGSMMEGFLPRGWDLAKIDACCSHPPEAIRERQPWWHAGFEPVACASLADFDVMLGHEIAHDDPPDPRAGPASRP